MGARSAVPVFLAGAMILCAANVAMADGYDYRLDSPDINLRQAAREEAKEKAENEIYEKQMSALNSAAPDRRRYARSYRYLFAGGGLSQRNASQDGGLPSSVAGNFTAGLDLDSLTTMAAAELFFRHSVGGGTTVSNQMGIVYFEIPIHGLFGNNPMAGLPGVNEMNGTQLWVNYPEQCKQLLSSISPWRVGIGIGFGALGIETPGRQYTNGTVLTTDISRARFTGVPIALRAGYFGPATMVRLTGYSMGGKKTKIGVKGLRNTILSMGGQDMVTEDVASEGLYRELKLDVYHRDDERIRAEKFITGYGMTMVYRQGSVEGQTFTRSLRLGQRTAITLPSIDFSQVDLTFTLGYMR